MTHTYNEFSKWCLFSWKGRHRLNWRKCCSPSSVSVLTQCFFFTTVNPAHSIHPIVGENVLNWAFFRYHRPKLIEKNVINCVFWLFEYPNRAIYYKKYISVGIHFNILYCGIEKFRVARCSTCLGICTKNTTTPTY